MMPLLSRWFRAPFLTRTRIVLALLVAVSADGLQFVLGWLGPGEWLIVDPAIDWVTTGLTIRLLGFHVLLPTFAAKLVPLVEELPSWTACVIAVVALRRRAQRREITELK